MSKQPHAPLLRIDALRVAYGHVEAVRELSLEIHAGEMVALVGANGAGKSTTLLALSGLVYPRSGRILWEGQDITRWPAHRRVAAGLVQVAEGRAILKTLTVRENLELGAYPRPGKPDLDPVFERFPILRNRASQLAGNLSGGEQQMLAIGRALLAEPRLLMLDEPSMGLAPMVVRDIFETLREIHQQGLTILLVEQNVRQALRLADRAYVLETGTVTLGGPAGELAGDPRVVAAYLGG
ncbi:MAG: ABC transporter ATP-binding protein [Betaproteobacteria bacterium]|nr:ABC transporter ATP-binding protein [Betaproteobacteria bacterium]MDE2131156.1 ABC transporter ATP-binding protein [Betaproteobacteria bacterium]MDE2211235.1 ABC transporter ATP-binding protein [Betaproteobacteria bacterium]